MVRRVTKNGCRAHAIERAAERYGLTLQRKDMRAMEERIIAGDAAYIGKGKSGAEKYMVAAADGELVPVVYDPKRTVIITVLPPEAAEVVRWRENLAASPQQP